MIDATLTRIVTATTDAELVASVGRVSKTARQAMDLLIELICEASRRGLDIGDELVHHLNGYADQ